jgi:MFS family permease
MKNLALVIASFAVTIICWGIYGPVLHWGQEGMSTILHGKASLRPFICVGLAYFGIGVAVPTILLQLRGEAGEWTFKGILFSLAGGALGALGALGIILAFYFGGSPSWVMPLVFGGAPVVNSFLTIFLARKMKEIGPIFLAGLIIVMLGAVTVLFFKPSPPVPAAPEQAAAEAAEPATKPSVIERETHAVRDFMLQVASIALVICCWGAYGPVLHIGQAAMHHSRLRPLICVGLAYFLIAVVVGYLWLAATGEASTFNFTGTFWSLMGGAAGAIGALGIIMAFNFGGKPVYVMPLVFGGAPVVNTFFTITASGLWDQVNALFVAGLLLVIAGAAMVLVFAPKGSPPPKPAPAPTPIPTEYPGTNPPA